MGLFQNLFSKKQALPTADLSPLITDMHSHLIPGIDDGAKTKEESLELIRELHALGYRKLITTPHIMSDHYKNTPEIINSGLATMQDLLKNENIPIQLEAAAEYYVDFDFEQKINNSSLMTFGKNYVLIELSFINSPDFLDGIIFKMRTAGYIPVLAHVERYPYWYNSKDKYDQLIDQGVLLQMNINSLAGQYSIQAKQISKYLIGKGMISFLGTDCHNMHYIEQLKSCLKDKYLHMVLRSGNLLNSQL